MENTPDFNIHIDALPFLNITLHLNNINFIQNLFVENLSEVDSKEVVLKIESDVPCLKPFSHTLATIPSEKQVSIPLTNLKINRQFINELTEMEKANITVSLSEGDTVLTEESFDVNVHPIEYFGGFRVMPQTIASFVTPNHSYVTYLSQKAASILEKEGLRPSFEAYQSGSKERVLQMISSVYSAIKSEGIVYNSLPPGYEIIGQRLRLLPTIEKEKFGNCIDISLLFAACLEAIDLNPILIIVKEHAFVGCWLIDDRFAQTVNDDKAALTKRISKGIKELVAVEATTLCRGSDISFSGAFNKGEAELVENEDFILSVDIKTARSGFIRPIPLANTSDGVKLDFEVLKKPMETTLEKKFDVGRIYTEESGEQGESTIDKFKVWERSLLDLTLRNNLLNLRMSRNMLQLVDVDINILEDKLWDGKSHAILADPNAPALGKYNSYFAPLHPSSSEFQMANDDLKYQRLKTYCGQRDLDRILPFMYKNARQAMEENGSSTLYLGIGLLEWYDSKTPEIPRLAPILLMPVELSRKSVRTPFMLRSGEEDTMINITLLELLKQEYKIDLGYLEDLPQDDMGVDVAKVMALFRRAVMQLPKWDVKEQLVLGNFSFSKLILWNDIVKNKESLLKSDIVKSLVERKLMVEDLGEVDPGSLEHIAPQTLTLPIPTDASQMEAVFGAHSGKSYILHGPPGTGKSQTITNIIADALYHGKRVLFVAAKKAALDVVYNRLQSIGLKPFTLELHSNTAKKSYVLQQLSDAMETLRRAQLTNFEEEANLLVEAKKSINTYIELLHKVQPWGKTLYESITITESLKNKNFAKKIIDYASLDNIRPATWPEWEDWLPRFISINKIIQHPSGNPLRYLAITNYATDVDQNIKSSIEKQTSNFQNLQEKKVKIDRKYCFSISVQTKQEWEKYAQLISLLQGVKGLPVSLIEYLATTDNDELISSWTALYKQYVSALQEIISSNNRDILKEDLNSLEQEWNRASQMWFLPKVLKKKKVRKYLNGFRKEKIQSDREVESIFSNYNLIEAKKSRLEHVQFKDVTSALQTLFKEEETGLSLIEDYSNRVQQINLLLKDWGSEAPSRWVKDMQADGLKILSDEKNELTSFTALFQEIKAEKDNLNRVAGYCYEENSDWPSAESEALTSINNSLSTLRDWINYNRIAEEGRNKNLSWFIDDFEQNIFSIDDAKDYFDYTIHLSLAHKVISGNETLSLFNLSLFETQIEKYKEVAQKFRELTIQELYGKLASSLPNTVSDALKSSEPGILQRAIRSRGRGLSVTKLFDQIPNLVPRIAPCMLMSPLSAAQYFDSDKKHFDLIIFDEASQLPTCESISALARAKQAIIVGDPKQMPPTSFFSSSKSDEEYNDLEDLESILDDCLALSMPSIYLKRHYRSKSESLISFSNVNYYDSKLLTFPSSDDLERKVIFHHLDGFYDKGKSRTNKFEADAIVQFVFDHYKSGNTKSLGIVTFSSVQQNLIENKLEELFAKHSEIEDKAINSEEPIFIKNLENVQGDERDIILFSVGYGPDEKGNMSMNFGPLNREGGWRRLNVAVTRSRYEMHVFATMLPKDIDLSRTAAEGVNGLKSFLNFALNGQLPVHEQSSHLQSGKKQLSEVIANRLREKGFKIKLNVGTSDFKVDLGIVHPERPGEYILGIITDGENYYHANLTNDRELVLPQVLKSLGWNLFRIWSIDWYEHDGMILDKVTNAVEELRKNHAPAHSENPKHHLNVEELIKGMMPGSADFNSDEEKGTVSMGISYKVTHLEIPPEAARRDISDPEVRSIVANQINRVIINEQPIGESLLFSRVIGAWGIARVGSRLRQVLEDIITSDDAISRIDHLQPFYIHNDFQFEDIRYRNNEGKERKIEEIPPEEIISIIRETLNENLSIEESELIRHVSKILGFSRVGTQVEKCLLYAIDFAQKQGIIVKEDDRVKIISV